MLDRLDLIDMLSRCEPGGSVREALYETSLGYVEGDQPA